VGAKIYCCVISIHLEQRFESNTTLEYTSDRCNKVIVVMEWNSIQEDYTTQVEMHVIVLLCKDLPTKIAKYQL